MLKNIYLGVLFFLIVLVFAAASSIQRNKDEVRKSIFTLFMVVIFSIISNSIYVMSDVKVIALVCHSLFLASVDWLLLLMLRYTIQYTENQKRMGKIILPLYVVAGVETVVMSLNPFFKHVFTLKIVKDPLFGIYYKPVDYSAYFYLHLVFSYFLVLWILALLLAKNFHTAKVYRKKYMVIIVSFVLVILFDAIGLALKPAIDISLIFYCLACFAIYFFSLYYVPKTMREKILTTAVQWADMGVGCFDIAGKCIYINKRGEKMIRRFDKFSIKDGDFAPMETYFEGWLKRHWKPGEREQNYVERISDGYRTYVYEFNIQKLCDEQDEFVGYFINCFDRTDEYEKYEEEHYRATHDMLTGIYNEQYFEQKVVETLGKFPDTPYVMITSDIRDFKLVNDLFGTERGDEVLKMHAQMFRRYAGENVVYGRLVEDKFGFCMPKERFVEQQFITVMKDIENMFPNDFFRLQIKMGVYEIKDIQEQVFVMIDKCNLAIDRIKDEYSRRVAYYDESLFRQEMDKYKIINEFDGALNGGEFEMFLQAQTTWEGKVIGAEALVRWRHPERGMLMPPSFVPILEKAGLIHILDLYIWEAAVKQLAQWKAQGREDLQISINISAKDSYWMDLYETFKNLTETYQVHPKNLKLEITETIFITDVERHLQLVQRLQSYGFEIAVDDFGSGYSSLNILKDITADELKIDMEFLQETGNKERSMEIVEAVVRLSKRLGMTVVVEGVETKEQVENLKRFGCDVYQGFYFSKPISVEEFENRYL